MPVVSWAIDSVDASVPVNESFHARITKGLIQNQLWSEVATVCCDRRPTCLRDRWPTHNCYISVINQIAHNSQSPRGDLANCDKSPRPHRIGAPEGSSKNDGTIKSIQDSIIWLKKFAGFQEASQTWSVTLRKFRQQVAGEVQPWVKSHRLRCQPATNPVSWACYSVRDSNLPISKGNPAVEGTQHHQKQPPKLWNYKVWMEKMSKSCQAVAIKIKNMPLEVLGTKDLKSGKKQHHKSPKTSWSTESETCQKCQKHLSSSHLFAPWDWDSFLKKHSSAGNTLHPPTLTDMQKNWCPWKIRSELDYLLQGLFRPSASISFRLAFSSRSMITPLRPRREVHKCAQLASVIT